LLASKPVFLAAPHLRRWRLCWRQAEGGLQRSGDWAIAIVKRSDASGISADPARATLLRRLAISTGG
jgi:hypothetical protein